MRYGVIFLAVGGFFAWRAGVGGWRLALSWPAVSFSLMGLAYLGGGPRLVGKRRDGALEPLRLLVLLPYLGLVRVAWHALRLVRRNSTFDELWPRIFVGRRLLAGEKPPAVDLVVDFTCEFEEPPSLRDVPRYLAIPTLDQTPPERQALLDAVDEVLAWPGTSYIHCAEGHGRAGTLAVCLAIVRGEADNLDDAVRWVRERRAGTRLTRRQRMRVREVLPELLARREALGGEATSAPLASQ